VSAPAPASLARLQELAEHVAATQHIPAIVWGLMTEGRLAHVGSVGALDDGSSPSARTGFRIASMTKSFTAATVLRLRDDGVVRLDDPVADLPRQLDGPSITLRHLLSMDSGLASDDPWADRHLDITDDELAAHLAGGVMFATPTGTAFEYSNLGYGVVGRVVRTATGEALQSIADRLLLRPLGFDATTWHRPDRDDWARPHRVEDGAALRDNEPLDDGAIAPMGGLWSNVEDLVRWMAWFDDAYPPRDGAEAGPLRRSSRREMQQVHRASDLVHTAASGEGLDQAPERIAAGGYGFGLQVRHDQRFGHHVTHSGGLPGYGSNMRWLPGRRIGIVALANSTYAPMRLMTMRMMELLDEHDAVPRAVTPVPDELAAAAERLVELLDHWDDAAADELFADNVALDEPHARRLTEARRVLDGHGALRVGAVVASSATSATMSAEAADGTAVTIELSLSPLQPPRVQRWSIRS